MIKSVLTKILVVLLVVVLIHSVFWFFKTGQLEKSVNNFVAENSANVSVGSVVVEGYPLTQRVIISDLRFSIPNSSVNKNKIVVQKLEITSGIFASDFTVSVFDSVAIQDSEGLSRKVEFNQVPQIALSIVDGEVSNFSYQDSGYKIYDEAKNVIYSAASTLVNIKSTVAESGEINSKINVKVKEIEGFDVVDIYKNSFEKLIIDAIKTGNISIGSNVAPVDPALETTTGDAAASDVATANVAVGAQNPDVLAANAVAKVNVVGAAPVVANVVAKDLPAVANVADPAIASAQAVVQDSAALVQASVDNAIAQVLEKPVVVKNDLIVNLEYILTPNKNDSQAVLPVDPSQIQVVATQYSRAFKINVVEISNSLYKISFNGQLNYFQDDNMPSGFIMLKVENVSKLIDQLKEGFQKIASKDNSDLQSFDVSTSVEISQDSYKNFLNKIIENLSAVSSEIAAKNQLSEGDVAVFDMRREKNLDVVVNEASFREILGKF